MELKLNIYGKDKKGKTVIKKTYINNDYSVEYGVLEDLLEIMEVYTSKTSEEELVRAVCGAMKNVKPLMLYIFEGLTEDELRHTRINEVAAVVICLLQYGLGSLSSISGKPKN